MQLANTMKEHSVLCRTLVREDKNDINKLADGGEITVYYLVHNESKTDHVFIIIDNAKEY